MTLSKFTSANSSLSGCSPRRFSLLITEMPCSGHFLRWERLNESTNKYKIHSFLHRRFFFALFSVFPRVRNLCWLFSFIQITVSLLLLLVVLSKKKKKNGCLRVPHRA